MVFASQLLFLFNQRIPLYSNFLSRFEFARTLEPDEIRKACKYKTTSDESKINDKHTKPEWRHELNCGKTYKPSYNIAPTDITPVLVSAQHFDFDEEDTSAIQIEADDWSLDSDDHPNEADPRPNTFANRLQSAEDRLLVPMMWGMVPFWHQGPDHRNHGLTTNNCRLENMLQSRLYGNAFRKGQRCVIVCEGFYEWQTTDPKATKASERAAYFNYVEQADGIKIEQKDTWSERAGELNLLKMAGLFDSWTNADGDQIFSYSIITFESDEKFSWLHHRSPAILETEQQVNDWLDFKRVTDTKVLLGLLKPASVLKWHPVGNLVNNSRNKSEECNKRLDEKKGAPAVKPKSKIMQSWLIVGKRKTEEGSTDESTVCDKKIKKESP